MSKSLCFFILFAFVFLNEDFAQWLLAMQVGGLNFVEAFNEAYSPFMWGSYLFSSIFRAIPFALLVMVVLSYTFKNNNAAKGIGWAGLVSISIANIYGYWRALHAFYTPEHVSSTTAISFIFIPFNSVLCGAVGGAVGYGLVRLYQGLKYHA